MDSVAINTIKQCIQDGEKLIWAGRPKKGLVFEAGDIFKTLYILFFIAVISVMIHIVAQHIIILAIFTGMIFYPFCILLGLARFFIDAKLRQKTFYGLTNKRIIIKSHTESIPIKSILLDSNAKITFLPTMSDVDTIDVGLEKEGNRGRYLWVPNIKANLSLYRIEDGKFVHKQIRELREALKEKHIMLLIVLLHFLLCIQY